MAVTTETYYWPSITGESGMYGRIRIRVVQQTDTAAGKSTVSVNLDVSTSYYSGQHLATESISAKCIGQSETQVQYLVKKSELYTLGTATLRDDSGYTWYTARTITFSNVQHSDNKTLAIKLYFTGTAFQFIRQTSPYATYKITVPDNGERTFNSIISEDSVSAVGSGTTGNEYVGNDMFYVPSSEGWETSSKGSYAFKSSRYVRLFVQKTAYDSSTKKATVSVSVQLRWVGGSIGARPNLILRINGADYTMNASAASVGESWVTVQTISGILCPYDNNGICAIDISCLPVSGSSPYYIGGPRISEEYGTIYYYWAMPSNFRTVVYLEPLSIATTQNTEINSTTDGVGSNDTTVVEDSKNGSKLTYYIPNSTGWVIDSNGKRYFRLMVEETAGSSNSTVKITTQIKGSPEFNSVYGGGNLYVSVGTGGRQRLACDNTNVVTNDSNFVDVQSFTLNAVAFKSTLKFEFLGPSNSTDPSKLCGYYRYTQYTTTREEDVEVGQYRDYVYGPDGNPIFDYDEGVYETTMRPIIQHNVITETVTTYYYFGVKAGTVVTMALKGDSTTGTQPDFGSNKGGVRVWNGSAWVLYTPYIWSGSAWVRYEPYIWSGSAWVKQG